MKRIRVRTLVLFGFACMSGAILLHTSQNVQQAEEKLGDLQSSIAQEQDSIKLLRTEWAFLNNPERLEMLAHKYLDLVPTVPDSIVPESSMIPAKEDQAPPSPQEAVPIAQPAVYKPPVPPKKPSLHSPVSSSSSSSSSPKIQQHNPPEQDFNALLSKISKGGKP